jgi:hypothetical protein
MRLCLSARAGLALVLGVAVQPLHGAPRSISVAEVRAEVTRLQAVVAACGTAGAAAACDPAAVGDDLRVGDPEHGGYELHWDWLRAALEKSKAAEPGKRGNLLRDSVAQLGRIEAELDGASSARQQEAQRNFDRARTQAAAVLARQEFQRDTSETWWDRLKARFFRWVYKFFDGLGRVGAAAPWIGPLLEGLFLAGAAVGLLFFLLRNLQRQRLRVALAGDALQASAWDREATDWAKLAEEYAGDGEWREAVHCLYWAAIVSLESRRAWRHNPTRTPREYLRLLKPGSPQQRGLRGLTRIFERVWYGLREAREEEYAEARALYEALATGGVDSDSAAAQTGGETSSAGGVA